MPVIADCDAGRPAGLSEVRCRPDACRARRRGRCATASAMASERAARGRAGCIAAALRAALRCGLPGVRGRRRPTQAPRSTAAQLDGKKVTSDRPIAECIDARRSACSTPTARVQARSIAADADGRGARREAKRAEREREAERAAQQATRSARDRNLLQRYPERGGAPQGARRRRSTTSAASVRKLRGAHRRRSSRAQAARSTRPSSTPASRCRPSCKHAARRQRRVARGADGRWCRTSRPRSCASTPLYDAELARLKQALGRRAAGLARAAARRRRPRRRSRRPTARTPTPSARRPVDAAARPQPSFLRSSALTCGRIGLALGRLHHLADERVERLLLAGAELRRPTSAFAAITVVDDRARARPRR